MKIELKILVLLLTLSAVSFGQDPMSRADALFFEYAYQDAILEYRKEMAKKPLTNKQFLNLADSYFKTGKYKEASDTYFEVYKKDSTMSSHHFNKMLQAMTKTSGLDRAKAILATRTSGLSSELLENADFNFQMLTEEYANQEDFRIFNIDGNSPQADFSPTFYKDRILFTSGRGLEAKNIYKPSGEAYLDIFVASVSDDGNFINSNSFIDLPDSDFHQATPFYSGKIKSFFYVNSIEENGQLLFDDNGKNSLAIAKSNPKGELLFLLKDLSTSFYYPFYDEKTGNLYFAANFKDSYGGTDIYYARTNEGQIMSAPINLGPRINTPGNEIAPYIFEGSFYYASDVFYGVGGMDVYKSEILEEGEFSIPINLGEGFNSSADDFGLIIKEHQDGELLGYFASNRTGGKGGDDIYGFRAERKPGLRTFALKGEVLNQFSQKGISKVHFQLLDSLGNTIREVYSSDNGSYRLEIPWQTPVTLRASKNKYSSYTATYGEADMESIQTSSYDVTLASLEDLVEEKDDQTVIKLNKFDFIKGQTNLTPAARVELDKVVQIISDFPQLQLRIESHTDSRGSSSANFRLSQGRAENIKKYLLSKGASSSNISNTVGFGEDKILNHCTEGVYCIEMLHKRNERHLIVVLNYQQLD